MPSKAIATLLMMSQMESLLFFYASVLVIAIGMSGTGGASAATVISHWFRRKRGRALGLMTLGQLQRADEGRLAAMSTAAAGYGRRDGDEALRSYVLEVLS